MGLDREIRYHLFLFVVMVETLSKHIAAYQNEGKWKGIQIAQGIEEITHQQFANDTLLYGESTQKETKHIKNCLEEYISISPQQINKEKLKVYLFNTRKTWQKRIPKILGYTIEEIPCRYLGAPLFKGMIKSKKGEKNNRKM